jgi:flagellar hook-length control protein FliK
MIGQKQAETDNSKQIVVDQSVTQAGVENAAQSEVQAAGVPDNLPQLSGEPAFLQSVVEQNPALKDLVQQLNNAIQNGSTVEQAQALQQLLEQGLQDENQPLLENLLTDKSTQKILSDGLSKLWTIQPQDVADSGKVEELYSRLDRQLKSLTQTLEQNGQAQSQTFRAASNMTQNLDFLQQINQAYTYVQLPLRLQQGDAHGDLYVYTNKRSLAAKDGQISALLHLDMEHLGPVDVYVAMQGEHVNTRFYVQDDEMLDFLEEHMDILTERLQKRGYDCNFAMQVRQKNEEPESGLKGLLAEEPALPIAQYSFDVRA